MEQSLSVPIGRRNFMRNTLVGGAGLGAMTVLSGCQSFGGFGLVDAIQRILYLSSERAFAQLLSDDGFWNSQVARLDLPDVIGSRGDVLSGILTSVVFKDRLQRAFNDLAYDGAERAAPLVTEAVRTIGIRNAADLINGGPNAATGFLRGQMGMSLIDAMIPALGDALRVTSDPLVGRALNALTGVDVAQIAQGFSREVDDAIWRQMGFEEAEIRRDPYATRDPLIIGVLGTR
ncbi:DUF4197 domain-containing protein [Pseudoblastomonas halimionae]|uniref:DUF4197 family protein n=1 Tax=Alteriqipengyuania halimionae TaxID=1926630 RepID=A0A6I4U4B2_9SPHN|nr:DUF4197 domain-containing protein [Alteriqipengyuania halimionae]MXP09067.1 DUF4197 family protein [Alteriqipengyuania halimionae]